ncbi:MAG: hypothetical protein Q9222_001909 [Ikaeria aurantiellina]
MLPAGKDFWSHPISFLATYGQVYKLHTDHVSAETAERRKKKVEDVQKRSRYRRAHGLENEQGIGGWTAKSNAESLGPAVPTQALASENTMPAPENMANESVDGKMDQAVDRQGGTEPSTFLDFEGKKRPVKRWLGIWE